MKNNLSPIHLLSLLPVAFSITGCSQQQRYTPIAAIQPNVTPAITKKVTIAIEDAQGGSGSTTTSFPPGPRSKPTVTIYWNGYGFIGKDDSGTKFWQYSNDPAFHNHPTAQFTLKKKVSITDKNGSSTLATSQKVTVKRGVPATF